MARTEPTLQLEQVGQVDPPSKPEEPLSEQQPENSVTWVFASATARIWGHTIDGLLTMLLFITLLSLSKLVEGGSDYADWVVIGIPMAYYLFCDALPQGQSLGKKVFNISVVSENGGHYCSLTQSFLRNLIVPFLGVFDAVFILSKKRKRLGDYLAQTVVIKKAAKGKIGVNSSR
ncbi:RDD family protein [Corallincola platygyrae]|uniref:RDD family protein n=1 Tax=Corallincola platygyrae TaxID=1193278 RepID=A0ABW4XIP7_9GAMM